MADPTNQPAPSPGVTNTPPAARDGGFAPELPHASDSLPIYRPLSILALAGFCCAVIYTVVIVVGVIITFLSGKPWLQDLWMVLIPLVVAGFCALGLVHVKRSEGTAAGAALGRWGLWLTAIVGLGYWSYYATIRYAVTSEADRFGRTFLEKIWHRARPTPRSGSGSNPVSAGPTMLTCARIWRFATTDPRPTAARGAGEV